MIRSAFLFAFLFAVNSGILAQPANWVVSKPNFDRAVKIISNPNTGGYYVLYDYRGENSFYRAIEIEQWDVNRNVNWSVLIEDSYTSNGESHGEDVDFKDAFLVDSARTLVVWVEVGDRYKSTLLFIEAASGEVLEKKVFYSGIFNLGIDQQGDITLNHYKEYGFSNRKIYFDTYQISAQSPFNAQVLTKAKLPVKSYESWLSDSNLLVFSEANDPSESDSTFLIYSSIPHTTKLKRANNFKLQSANSYRIEDQFLAVDFEQGTLKYMRLTYDTINGDGRYGYEFGTYDFLNDVFVERDTNLFPKRVKLNFNYIGEINREAQEIERFSYRDTGKAFVEVLNFDGDLIRVDSFLNMFEIRFHDVEVSANERIYAGSVNGEAYIVSYGATSTQDIQLAEEPAIKLYPNPANYTVQLEVELQGTIQVFDVLGKQMVQAEVLNKYQFSTKDWPAGTYYYTFTTNSGITSSVLIVSH